MDYLRGWIGDIPSRPAAINREGATVRISTSEAISRPPRHSEFKRNASEAHLTHISQANRITIRTVGVTNGHY